LRGREGPRVERSEERVVERDSLAHRVSSDG
jgi:hypothetical protein